MIKKTLIALTTGAALFTASAMAGTLTLQSINENTDIAVKCGSSQSSEKPAMPIPHNKPLQLPYWQVAFLGHNLYCDFFENSKDIGTAHLIISNLAQTATVESWSDLAPTDFNVAVNTPVNTPTDNLTVTLTKLK